MPMTQQELQQRDYDARLIACSILVDRITKIRHSLNWKTRNYKGDLIT